MQKVISRSISSQLCSYITKLSLLLCVLLFISACNEKTAEDYFEEANAFSESGDNDAAIVALKNAVQEAPSWSNARFELGKLNLALKDYETASKELARALEFGYAESEVIPMLAEAFQRSGANVALADLRYQASSLTESEQLEVGYRKVQSLFKLDKQEQASALINELLLINIDTAYKGMIKGYELIIALKYKEALETVNALLADAPLNRDLINLTARLYILNGDDDNAADLYEAYIAIAKDDVEATFSLANILIKKQPARAEKYIDELLALDSNNGSLNQLKSISRAAADDYQGAKEYAEKAIYSGQSDLNLRLIVGFASYKLEDFEGAIRHLSVVAESLPDDHPALRMLADSQLQLNMGEDAGLLLSRVDNISTEDISLFSRAGYELIKAGNLKAAKEIIKKTEKVSETSDELTQLGALKLSLNDLEGVVDLESAVAKSPTSLRAKTVLASAYLGTQQLDKAMVLAKQWQSDEPTIVDGYLLEAEVLERQQRYLQASKTVDQAAKIDELNLDVQLASIRLDILQNKNDQALIKTEAFLEREPSNVFALISFLQLKREAGDARMAIVKIEEAARKNPENQALVLLGARTMLLTNRLKEALEMLSTINANRTSPSAYWELKGTALFRSGNNAEAVAHYTDWVTFFPNEESPTIALLTVLGTQNSYAEAAKIAAKFGENKENLQIRLMEAYFKVMSRDTDGAKRILANLDSKYQSVPFVRGIKARIALVERRGPQAIEDAKASFIANKKPENLFVYVQTLESAGKTNEAYQIIEAHLLEFPSDIRSKSLLAERQVAKDPAAALITYEEMLQESPNNPVLLNNAGYLHMKANNMDKAFQYSVRAYNISPENVALTDTYSQLLMRRGETNQAVEAYNKVINQSVTDEEVILNYIEALFKNSNMLTAKRSIQDFKSTLKSEESKERLLILQAEFSN